MLVIFCAWSSFITIKYNCTLTKLTPCKVHILFAKLLKCYIFFPSNFVHESATIQDLFRRFFHFTLGGYQMVAPSNLIIPCLNKGRRIAVISYSKSFSTSSSFCASAVSLLKSEVGVRLIYFLSFMTTVLYRLAIGWTFDLDLIFVVCCCRALLFRKILTLIYHQLHQKVNVWITSHTLQFQIIGGS